MIKKSIIPVVGLLFLLLSACNSPGTNDRGNTDFFTTKGSLELKYHVYKPAAYENDTRTAYPAIYLLHGHGGDHDDWFQKEEGDVARILDSLIGNELIPPMLAFSLDAGNSWYVDRQVNMETFYMEEFIPETERNFRIDPGKGRFMAGNSAGGYGALRFALKFPSKFDAAILLSPAAYYPAPPNISSSRKVTAFELNGSFNDSIWRSYAYPKLLDSLQAGNEQPAYYLSVGDDDRYNIVPVVSRLQQLFLEYEAKNELRITNGGHDWKCWKVNFANALTEHFKGE